MPLLDREKNSIVIAFIFNIVLLIVFMVLWLYHTYWKYEVIEWHKKELTKIVNSITLLESEWLTFAEFKWLISTSKYEKNEYLDFVLRSITNKFYVDNFINKEGWKFEDFLIDKERVVFDNWL